MRTGTRKSEALDIIMDHYSQHGTWDYREHSFERTCIIKVAIETITGRKAGYGAIIPVRPFRP